MTNLDMMNTSDVQPNCCDETAALTPTHPNYKQLLNRLRRTEGQVRGVINMVEENRYCVDILVQTRAIVAALKAAEAEILNSHISHCVTNAVKSNDPIQVEVKLQELVGLMQRMS